MKKISLALALCCASFYSMADQLPLGGTSLSGGVGFVLPTVVGAMIMGIIDNILTLMNVNPHATNIVKGAVILIAVLVDKKVKDLSAKAE